MTVAPTSIHPRRERHSTRLMLGVVLAFLVGAVTVGLLYESDWFGGSSSSTTEGSGVPATQSRDVAAFQSVVLAGSNNVVIRVGQKQSVVVKGDDNLLGRVTTEVQSGKLVIANTSGSFSTRSPMRVEVAVPTLAALTLSGSGNFVVDGIHGRRLEVTLPGSGTLTGSGTTTQLDATVGGSGTIQFTRLVAKDVRAGVSGSGSIFVTATEKLDASVSGSGAILYAGSPTEVTKSVTGSGAITGG
jgi:Putative auto-transporter adhesin, head GIN domain